MGKEGRKEAIKQASKQVTGRRKNAKTKEVSYLFRYGLLTPAIFGVSHLTCRKHVKITPSTAVIKHILADSVIFSFRRLLIYAPIKEIG